MVARLEWPGGSPLPGEEVMVAEETVAMEEVGVGELEFGASPPPSPGPPAVAGYPLPPPPAPPPAPLPPPLPPPLPVPVLDPNPEVHAALPTLEAVHITHIPTHKFPPRAVRGELARALTTLWGQMADRGLEHHYTLQQQQQQQQQQQVAMKAGEE